MDGLQDSVMRQSAAAVLIQLARAKLQTIQRFGFQQWYGQRRASRVYTAMFLCNRVIKFTNPFDFLLGRVAVRLHHDSHDRSRDHEEGLLSGG